MPVGVDDAAKVCDTAAVAHGTEKMPADLARQGHRAAGTTLGGYNLTPLIDLLDDAEGAPSAAEG